ncbi:poly [ADP-ribose] polymerase 14-like isoform X1 [Labeo rohita]|uniref:Poly [ADP-ribose] polymerase n=1 Tax=Labeo rohita TaxID=84645 RepID=A0A498LT51_LABRO|nr:poly [ADP-ribose] polymerase 14-like isoform X1 [Labeo rohita]
MEKSIVFLSPDPVLLKQKGVTREHIDGWSKNAIDAFKKIISNYTTTDWPVSHPLWSKVESDVKEVVKDQVFTYLDASKEVLTLAGMTHEITGLKPIMEKILERATNQMEREKNSVTEYMKISPAMYLLLELDGLKNALAVSPELHTDYNKKMNRLVLSGLHTEICMFKNWVLQKQINRKKKSIQTEHSILEFLKSVDCGEMSRDLFISNGITAVYTIENGDVVVIGSTERALNEAESMINTNLTTKDLIVEDQGVLQMPEWLDLKKHLQELFSTSKKSSVIIHLSKEIDKVMVTGFREPVMKVSQDLGDFIEKHTRIEETVRVKSHAAVELIKDRKSHWQHFTKSDKVKVSFDSKRLWIKLSGERTFVQPAVTFFKTLADGLYTDTLIIKKTGAKKYFMEQGKIMLSMFAGNNGFVAVLQEDTMPEEEKDNFSQGQGGANSSDVADAMINAVVEFANINEHVHVRNVEFLIFNTSKNILFEEIEPVMFQLCGETLEDLSKASALINSLINKENMHITICDPAIAHFSKEELEMLSKMEKELKVSVIPEKKGQDSVITLKGLTGFVQNAESRIRDIIRKVERNENRKRLANLTSSIVEWQYQSGHNFKAFDIFTNFDLEEAFKLQTTSVLIKIDSEVYDADIVRKVATKGRKQTELKRVELKAQNSLPSHWEDVKGQLVVLVKVTAGSKEYADVEKEFKKTGLSSSIIEIERVQNSALWRNYMIKKEELEDKNKHKNNEKLLFHGTGPDTTDQINNHGFNRSFAGMHGALYGNGTYFAVDPSYSSKGYSKPDNKGHKRMYLARVLVGDFTQGTKGLPTPPKKSSQGVHLYDSVTDNMNNPTMFVIFNDVQAYPEYLITFRDK